MNTHQILLANAVQPGQQVFTSSGSWTVPFGVTDISVVCVQQGGDASATGTEVIVGGSTVCRAKNGARVGDGAEMADPAATRPTSTARPTMAAVAGRRRGYPGTVAGHVIGIWRYRRLLDRGGGGGGSDGRGRCRGRRWRRRRPLGSGSSGAGGAYSGGTSNGGSGGSSGTSGGSVSGNTGALAACTGRAGGNVGLGSSSGTNGGAGGALAYKNNIAVTPGASVTITIPATASANRAVRIMWGVGRAYPSTNTADM